MVSKWPNSYERTPTVAPKTFCRKGTEYVVKKFAGHQHLLSVLITYWGGTEVKFLKLF